MYKIGGAVTLLKRWRKATFLLRAWGRKLQQEVLTQASEQNTAARPTLAASCTPTTPVSNLIPLSLSRRFGLTYADRELFTTQSSAGSLDNHVAVRGDWVAGTAGCAEAATMRRAKAAMNFILEWALLLGERSGVGGIYRLRNKIEK